VAWSVLQSNSNGVGTGSTVSAAYTGNLTSGTKLIAVVTVYTTTTSTVKDGAGNSFTKLAAAALNNSTSANGELSLWAMDTPAGDAGAQPTITATPVSATGFYAILIQEVSGLLAGNTSAMLDGTAGTSFANGSTSLACGAYSSAAAGEYLIALYGDDQNVDLIKPSSASGSTTYTLDASNIASHEAAAAAYGNSTGGAETATFAIPSSTNDQGTILVAFKLASTGTDTSPAWATSASDLGGGSGSWVNPGNADGAPDSSYATWTAP
jgi:hypothetical protein